MCASVWDCSMFLCVPVHVCGMCTCGSVCCNTVCGCVGVYIMWHYVWLCGWVVMRCTAVCMCVGGSGII